MQPQRRLPREGHRLEEEGGAYQGAAPATDADPQGLQDRVQLRIEKGLRPGAADPSSSGGVSGGAGGPAGE